MIKNQIYKIDICLYIPDIEQCTCRFKRVPVHALGLLPICIFKDMYNFDGNGRRHAYCISRPEEVPIYA